MTDVAAATRSMTASRGEAFRANLPAGWGGIEGSLASTATPAPLYITLGALLLAIAAVLAIRS